MSVVEEQAKELGVDAAGGAKDGGQKRDPTFELPLTPSSGAGKGGVATLCH